MPDLHGLRVYDRVGNIRLDTNDRQARLVMSYYSTSLIMPGTHDVLVPGISATDPTWALAVSKCFYNDGFFGDGECFIHPDGGKVTIASAKSAAQAFGYSPSFVISFSVYRI